MSSVFTRIIKGEIPCYKIAENENYFAFLDINPLKRGHTLVVPKIEIDKLFDLDEKTYLGLMDFSRKIALAIEKATPCNRVGMTIVGLEVPHAHVHLIPINNVNDINFDRKKEIISDSEFLLISEGIRKFIY
ncbi:MAG: HIT family protein [Bacteroidota bacterium]|jgi:histidine triad (HIT) family protein